MSLTLGQLLRFKGMVDAAAETVAADGASAPALTDAYMRLRTQLGDILDGDLSDEFNEAFPTIPVVTPPGEHPRQAARAGRQRVRRPHSTHAARPVVRLDRRFDPRTDAGAADPRRC
jgi:hypothetical protein